MRLEHYSVDKLKKEILTIVGNYLDLSEYKVFFFGSRVTGKGDERSDIDVGIEGMQKIPTLAWADIEDKMEDIPTLYKIEVVDFARVDPGFKDAAQEHVEYLN